jgi:very-short-patch-repair endonuclease
LSFDLLPLAPYRGIISIDITMKDLKGIYGWRSMKHRRWELRLSMTKAEEILWQKLRKKRFLGVRFRRQHGIGPYVVDFYHSKSMTVIEIDGAVHFRREVMEQDLQRQEFLENLGYAVLRFSNNQIENSLNFVLKKIKDQVIQKDDSPVRG